MAKARAFVSGFSISALGGLMQSFGDLVPTIETGAKSAEEFKSVCPVCAEANVATKVAQQYICLHEPAHGPFTQGTVAKAKEIDKQLVLMNKEEVDTAKKSDLPNNAVELEVFRRADVEPFIQRTTGTYVFRDGGRGTLFPILLNLLQTRPDLTFIGTACIKESEKLVCVELGLNGQLMVVAVEWPGDLRQFDVPEVPEVKSSLVEMAAKLLDEQVGDFDPESYVKGARSKLNALVAAAANGAGPALHIVESEPQTTNFDNLEELLRKSLERQAS